MAIRKVTRHGSTRLFIDIRYRRKDGSKARYRKDAQVHTMAAARAEERRILANIAHYGEPFEPKAPTPAEETPAITFKEAVDLFRKGKAISELKPSTRRGYNVVLDSRLVPRWGDTAVNRIAHRDATALDAELVEEGLSPSSRRNVQIVLRSVLVGAHEAGKLAELPKLPALPKVGRTVLRVLTRGQVDRLLRAAEPHVRLALALAAFAGLRAGEVRGLVWGDIDLVQGTITVRRAICQGETASPKSGDQRCIPIAPPLRILLEEATRGATMGQQDPVSTTRQGSIWGEPSLLRAMKSTVKRAGIGGNWTYHDLRHFFATQVGGSSPAPVVQALLGHGNLSVTQRYMHVVSDDLRAAVAHLGNWGNNGATASAPLP